MRTKETSQVIKFWITQRSHSYSSRYRDKSNEVDDDVIWRRQRRDNSELSIECVVRLCILRYFSHAAIYYSGGINICQVFVSTRIMFAFSSFSRLTFRVLYFSYNAWHVWLGHEGYIMIALILIEEWNKKCSNVCITQNSFRDDVIFMLSSASSADE